MTERGIAILGCGYIGRVHAESLQLLVEAKTISAKLVVACDVVTERAEHFKQEFGFDYATSDPLAALADPNVSVVYICTPTNQHKDLVLEAAKSGLDIFCEKPLALSAIDAQIMDDSVNAAGVLAQVGLVLRYSPLFSEVKKLLDDHTSGRPMAAVLRSDQCIPIKGAFQSQWRVDATISGGGTLIEHSIHDLDLLTWYFGPLKQVFAQTSNFFNYSGIETVAAVLLTFDNGVQASLQSVWHNVERRVSERRLEIFCEQGWLRSTGDFSGEIETQVLDQDPVILSSQSMLAQFSQRFPDFNRNSRDNAFLYENIAYWRSLEDKQKPSPSLSDGVRAQRLVDAIYESAKQCTAVNVETLFTPVASVTSDMF